MKGFWLYCGILILFVFCSCADTLSLSIRNKSDFESIVSISPIVESQSLKSGDEILKKKSVYDRGSLLILIKNEKDSFAYRFNDVDHWGNKDHQILINIWNDSLELNDSSWFFFEKL